MEYRFRPRGVCSQEMIIELDGDIIKISLKERKILKVISIKAKNYKF